MPSTLLHRSFSAWCVLLFFGVSFAQAAEFKPFLKLQIAGSTTLYNIAEKVGAIVDPEDTSGLKANLALYNNIPGFDPAGTISLALQANQESALFGMDILLLLPINDLTQLDIPGLPDDLKMALTFVRAMKPSGGKYVLPTPFGKITAYQKEGYFLIATEGAAALAATADPKQFFAEVNKFTFGVHVDLENVSVEILEPLLNNFAMFLPMQGADGEENFDKDVLLKYVSDNQDEFSSFTAGVTLNPETLDLTGAVQITPKQGSAWAEKIRNVKNTKTKLNAFLPETPQTVFSYHNLDYYTDNEIEEMRTVLEVIGKSFMEGLSEAVEDGNGSEQLVQAADLFLEYAGEVMDFFAENRLADYTVWLDSEGTFLFAIGTDKTAAITELDGNFLGSLLEIFGGEAGKTFMEAKTKKDYDTIAGYSLSCVPNLFADLPDNVDFPDAVKNIPLSVFWAVKEGEAVAYAAGLDFDRTEKTFKDALTKTAAPVPPRQQTFVFALKPFGELLQKHVLPLFEQAGADYEYGKNVVAKLGNADASAKMEMTTEFPGNACRYNFHVNGKLLQTLLEVFAEGFTTGTAP